MSAYALVQDGKVTNLIEWDGVPFSPGTPAVEPDADGNGGADAIPASGWSPPDGVSAIALNDGDVPHIGLGYADGVFEQPAIVPPSPSDILASNSATRDALLAAATVKIAPLQDAADLGIATSADSAALTAWKTYRVAVNRIDLTQATPTWPAQPA